MRTRHKYTRHNVEKIIKIIAILETALQEIAAIDNPQGSMASAALVEAEDFYNIEFGDQDEKSNSST